MGWETLYSAIYIYKFPHFFLSLTFTISTLRFLATSGRCAAEPAYCCRSTLACRLRSSNCFRLASSDDVVAPEFETELIYRVSHLLVDLGWVDSDLGVPPSCTAAYAKFISAEAESGWQTLECSKFKSTQPSPRADGTPCI